MSNEVFKHIKDIDAPIDWSKPDYTGESADHYLHKYVNRPEDAGTLEGLQNVLSSAGIVAPPADAINAAIFLARGEYGMAGLSIASIVPFFGEIKKGWQSLKKGMGLGEEYVTLYRGVQVDDIDKMVSGNKIYGNWGQSTYAKKKRLYDASHRVEMGYKNTKRVHFDGVIGSDRKPILTTLPESVNFDNILFTTNKKSIAVDYAMGGGKTGYVLEFKLPRRYVTNNGRSAFGNRWNTNGGEYLDSHSRQTLKESFPSTIFPDGLPSKFLTKVHNIGQTPVNQAQKSLFKEHAVRKASGKLQDVKFIGDDVPDAEKVFK